MRWTDEDISQFKSLYESQKYDSMAKIMGRSVLSLKAKARSLGIATKPGGRHAGVKNICSKGLHELTEDNVWVRVRKSTGRVERQCKACMNAAARVKYRSRILTTTNINHVT